MEVAAANLTANSCSFDHVHFILTNGFAHSSLDKMSIKRSTVKRAAKKFALKGKKPIAFSILSSGVYPTKVFPLFSL